MQIIDSHVHVWTDELERYPLAPGFSAADMKPPVFTPEDIIAHAEPRGVDRIVLVQMSYYGTDNRYMLHCMAQYPGVFGGIAVVDEQAPDIEAQMERLGEQGVRGFRIQPRQAPVEGWLESSGYERMFRQAAASGQSLCCLIDANALPALDAACGRFPETSVVIDHLCRIGVDGEIRGADVDALCGMARHERVKVKVSAFYALGHKRPPHEDLIPLFERVHGAFGPRRLMWGSDCPYQVQQESYEDGLAPLRDWLSAEDAEWVLRRTAEETFF